MNDQPSIGILGGGSWATAIIKILMENAGRINWYIRRPERIQYIRNNQHNPNYLSSVDLDLDKIKLFNDINETINESEILIFAIPAPFLQDALKDLSVDISDKVVVSAIKGIVPDGNLIIGEFFHQKYRVPLDSMVIISGPCHAEEVALERLSYLTFASMDLKKARLLSGLFETFYIKAKVSDDIYGTEYASVLKNIFAIAAGICHGLGYGDNFQAVLLSNSIQEIKRFLDRLHPITRDIKSSAYLGDLIVTAYSQFSRNRTFGNMIGKGYSVKSAQLEMNMIAEGYFATKCIYEINKEYMVTMPITEAVYNILYEGISPAIEIQLLTEHLA